MSSFKIIVILLINFSYGFCMFQEVCDRRPLGTKTAALPPDNRFVIEVKGISDDKYIPTRKYPVQLYSRNGNDTFIAFTISAKEDEKENEKNPRRPLRLDTGHILPSQNSVDGIASPVCNNTVIQGNVKPKQIVEATWIAPPKDNKCVTIYALLAVKTDVWYSYDGPLSQRVCEDRRNNEDIQPPINTNCEICEEARYQVTFEGLWSPNTHPQMFPVAEDLARFSDIVGASHSRGFHLWNNNEEASDGLKMLAEQGNTTILEIEIQKTFQQERHDVRTLIKATGQPRPNLSTSATFRVSREHHLVSLVTSIIPSPDWFLGVSNMELCDVMTKAWASNITFNLYPLDAGTDSGPTFESPNEGTSPPQPISKAIINKITIKENTKPFARLRFNLIKTYPRPNCIEITRKLAEREGEKEITTTSEPITSGYDEIYSPGVDCPMTEWDDWIPSTCDFPCEDGHRSGYQVRERYHLVQGHPVDRFGSGSDRYKGLAIPKQCQDSEKYPQIEHRICQEEC